MSVALRGNLKDFGIAEVFQLIGQQRKTGILEFSGSGQRVELRFDRGAIVTAAPAGPDPHTALGEMLVRCGLLTRERVDRLQRDCKSSAQTFTRLVVQRGELSEQELAEVEDLLTRETIFAIMRWSRGSFDFIAQEVEHERAVETLLGAEQILMDGLRMVDEWHSFSEFVPSERTIFRRVERFDIYRDRARGELQRRLDVAERVFFLIDGRLAVRRIIDLSRLGTFEATRILADLRRAGVIEQLGMADERRMRLSVRTTRLDRATLRGWLAFALPLFLLLMANAVAFRQVSIGDERPGIAVQRAPLEEVRQRYAVLRVRHALEAYRFSEGHWPAHLGQLEERGLLDAGALASSSGRPYYYAHRGGGVVLLAPER